MQETRRRQLLIREKGRIQGQLVPRPKDGRKPKGSRNVPSKENGVQYSMDETLKGEKLKQPPMVDFNSSFDDIDTEFFFNPDGEKACDSNKIVFSAPVKCITFNPVNSKLSEVARQLLPAKQLEWREKDDGNTTDSACDKKEKSDAIYKAEDSDYYSIDLDFFKCKELLISPIKDAMDVNQASSKRQRPNPLEGANQISKLARKYDQSPGDQERKRIGKEGRRRQLRGYQDWSKDQ